MIWHEGFARVWYVGLALTPLLLAVAWRVRRGARPEHDHAMAVAVVVGLLLSVVVPVIRDAGPWLSIAREDFRATGLAPCLAPRAPAAPEPNCLTYQWATPWLWGTALLLGWHGLGLVVLRRLRRAARPAPAEVHAEVQRAAAALDLEPPAVVMVDRAISPLVAGLRRPLLALPVRLWERLAPAEREAILLHELAHLRRHDLVTLGLAQLVRAVFWWHPAVWWLRAETARAAELASDRLALRTRPERAHALGRALLAVERFAARPRLLPAAAAQALSPAARELARRLHHLVDDDSPPARFPRAACAAAFAMAIAIGSATVQITLG